MIINGETLSSTRFVAADDGGRVWDLMSWAAENGVTLALGDFLRFTVVIAYGTPPFEKNWTSTLIFFDATDQTANGTTPDDTFTITKP